MQRSSCSRLRASTSPKVLIELIRSSFVSLSSVETPGGFEPPWHGLQPCASPLGHGVVEPPRGVEPLLAGSKPAALSSELRRRCSAGRRRLGRRRFQPQCPVYSRDASSSRWRRSYGSNSSTKACRKTRRAARSVSILCREFARPSSESTSKVNSMACELVDSSRIICGSKLYVHSVQFGSSHSSWSRPRSLVSSTYVKT